MKFLGCSMALERDPVPIGRIRRIRNSPADSFRQSSVADRAGCLGEGDALITNQPGIMLSIRTADCLPILMADPVESSHSGRPCRLARDCSRIAPKTITDDGGAVREPAGGSGSGCWARNRSCCFEVGPEVAMQFSGLFPERGNLDQRTKIDLVETIRRQLGRNDGTMRQFATWSVHGCRADLFHSYRRDREAAGRMVSALDSGKRAGGLIHEGASLLAPFGKRFPVEDRQLSLESTVPRQGVRLHGPEDRRANRYPLPGSCRRFPGTECSRPPTAQR